jgi:hypothetical protein
MVEKEHIANFLRINGISLTAPDDEIRNALIYARWHERDIEYALLVLRDDNHGSIDVTASHGILVSDRKLAPETLTSLLGIDVSLDRNRFSEELTDHEVERTNNTARSLVLLTTSVFFAFLAAMLIMFLLKIGPYYSPLEQSFF